MFLFKFKRSFCCCATLPFTFPGKNRRSGKNSFTGTVREHKQKRMKNTFRPSSYRGNYQSKPFNLLVTSSFLWKNINGLRILLLGDKQGSKTIFVSNGTEGMPLIGFFIGRILLWIYRMRIVGDMYSLYIFIACCSRIRSPKIGMSLSDKNSYFFVSAPLSLSPLWPKSMVILIGFL